MIKFMVDSGSDYDVNEAKEKLENANGWVRKAIEE